MKPPPEWGAPPPPLPTPPPAWPTRPPPPPVSPTPPDARQPREPSRDNWLLIGAIAAGLLFLLAFTASGARSLGRDHGHPDYGSVAVRSGIGLAIALVIGAAALLGARYASQRDNAFARALVPERPITTRALVARSLPWLAVLLALGAVLGASTAPLYRTGTSSKDDATGRSVDPRLPTIEGRLARDADGFTRVQIDPDGDGRYATLTPCDDTSSNERPRPSSPPSPEDPSLVPVDYECDGVIDAYARVDSLEIEAEIEAAPGSRVPDVRPDDPPRDTYGNDADLVQERYDGIYVEDADGDVGLFIDVDGDGEYETPLVDCPLDSGAISVPSTVVPERGAALVPIDQDCDGTIDAYARVEDFQPIPASPDAATSPTAPPRTRPPVEPPTTSVPERGDDVDDGGDGGGMSLPLIIVLIGLGGTLLAGLAYLASRALLRRDAEPDPTESAPADLSPQAAAATGAITSSLDDLALPEDPREAIIRAYARLLDGLSAGGMPRRASETPGLYLQRCVDQLGVPRAPMEQLTELFTQARFSSRPMSEDQRAQASACLERAVADIRRTQSAELAGATS